MNEPILNKELSPKELSPKELLFISSLFLENEESEEERKKHVFSNITYMDVNFRYDDPIAISIINVFGLKRSFANRASTLFELNKFLGFKRIPLREFLPSEREELNKLLNDVVPDKADLFELVKHNILRKFVIASYQGICHAHGKPIKGQSTRFNG